ncbi:hypothetical protein ZHAS_00019765 [Anopheles sinensis]|uniref:Uncharacterized protein n=1 Tax=Anopheles sinensis TaxID=74873 RepID=A0A084WME2_ANOSI|nr:hypothetical protein ZHAS_00019765 [Anopheles sinensis]
MPDATDERNAIPVLNGKPLNWQTLRVASGIGDAKEKARAKQNEGSGENNILAKRPKKIPAASKNLSFSSAHSPDVKTRGTAKKQNQLREGGNNGV